MPLSVDEVQEKQRKVYVYVGVLVAVVFFGLMAHKTLTMPRFGQPCQDECLTGQCLQETHMLGQMRVAGDAYCTRSCEGADECPAGYVCDGVVEVKDAEGLPVMFIDPKKGVPVNACVRRK